MTTPASQTLVLTAVLTALAACVAPPSAGEEGATKDSNNANAVVAAKATGPADAAFPPDPAFAGDPVSKSTLPGGIVVEEFVIGEGPEAKPGAEVSVHYYGTLADGTMFDTSRKRGVPFSFPLGQGRVIKGWDQGVPGMKVGGKRRLTIPSDLAYGPRAKGKIPANSELTFTIELVDVFGPLPPGQGDAAFAGEPQVRTELEGGLIAEDFVVGQGRVAAKGDKVYVHYTGKLDDGTVFDSSLTRNKAIDFVLGTGRVIKGWDQGIAGMKVGGLRRLTIPSELAYGPRAKGKIPADSRLTFTVELMAVRDAPKPAPHARPRGLR